MQINIIDFGAKHFPLRKHFDDFGADVFAPADYFILPHSRVDMPLGFGIEIPLGYGGYIEPRGSMGNCGLLPVSNPIDSGYRGEIHAVMWNISDVPVKIEAGDRVAQLVIRAGDLSEFKIISKEEAAPTARGDACYGSTGR